MEFSRGEARWQSWKRWLGFAVGVEAVVPGLGIFYEKSKSST